MKTQDKYTVEVDTKGCPHCGKGKYYMIIDPEEIGSSTSYGDIEEAEDICEDLNRAYKLGKKHKNEN